MNRDVQAPDHADHGNEQPETLREFLLYLTKTCAPTNRMSRARLIEDLNSGGVGTGASEISEFLAKKRNLSPRKVTLIWRFVKREFSAQYSIYAQRDAVQDLLDRAGRNTQLSDAVYTGFNKFYECHSSQITNFINAGIIGYYYVFKHSFRYKGCAIKSICLFRKIGGRITYIEIQKSRSNELKGTIGSISSKTNYLWIHGKDLVYEQPRIICLDRVDKSEVASSPENDIRTIHGNIIDSMSGFCLESYHGYENSRRVNRGIFHSPVAYRRIPETVIKNQILRTDVKIERADDIFLDINIPIIVRGLMSEATIIGGAGLIEDEFARNHLSVFLCSDSCDWKGDNR